MDGEVARVGEDSASRVGCVSWGGSQVPGWEGLRGLDTPAHPQEGEQLSKQGQLGFPLSSAASS